LLSQGSAVREVGKPGNSVDADTVFSAGFTLQALASTWWASVVGEGGLSWDEAVVKRFCPSPDRWSRAIAAKVPLRDPAFRTHGLPDPRPVNHSKDIGFDRARFLSACAFCQSVKPLPRDLATPTSDYTAAAEGGPPL